MIDVVHLLLQRRFEIGSEVLILPLQPCEDTAANAFVMREVVGNLPPGVSRVELPFFRIRVAERQGKLGFECIALELDEFLKAGGSAKCLTLRLDGEEAAIWDD